MDESGGDLIMLHPGICLDQRSPNLYSLRPPPLKYFMNFTPPCTQINIITDLTQEFC
jgi:hypothetical protein